MNREIKFRVRNTDTNKWEEGLMVSIGTNLNDYKSWMVFQQFTGLKDRNGKDIYEDDILEWTSKFRDTKITTPPIRGIVKYNRQACAFHIDYELNDKRYFKELNASSGAADEDTNYVTIYYMDTVSVIGNIFENPELLS